MDSADTAPLPWGHPPGTTYRMPSLADLPPTPWQWREVGPGRADQSNHPVRDVFEDTSLHESEGGGWALDDADGAFLLSCEHGEDRVEGGAARDLFEIAPLLAKRVRELERLIQTMLTLDPPAWGAAGHPTHDRPG